MKYQIRHITLIFALFAIFLFACERKNEKPVVIVSPFELIQTGNPGDVKSYSIKVESEISLSRFRIFTKFENEFEILYKDSALSTKNFNWNFEYKIPQTAAGKVIYFRFSAIDTDGNEGLAVKEIITGDKLLIENTGLQFYSFSNSANNAFNLETLGQESYTSDSTNRDIQEYVSDSLNIASPSYKWTSPAGGKFVKANTYDYANATLLTAKNIYDGSIALVNTDSLVVGDIYITRLGSLTQDKYCVLKITGINEIAGSGDNYTFNVKK